jgi:hypothetical protein
MRRGAVSVPHGHPDANVNVLTSHLHADPITGMAHYSGVPVSVHPAQAPSQIGSRSGFGSAAGG